MRARVTSSKLESLVAQCLKDFYRRRLSMLDGLQLKKVLRRKNPYLFRALGIEVASEIVHQMLHAFVSSSDEGIFGAAFFEPIAMIVSGGKVSDAAGVDFVVETRHRYTAVALKSGPNIYNASQKKRQNQEFIELRNRLLKIHKPVDPLLGHAYGKRNVDPKGAWIFRVRSGQAFWEEITGDAEFYVKLIVLMKSVPAEHKKELQEKWGAALNRFTQEFIQDFCHADGRIDWDKLLRFVSQKK